TERLGISPDHPPSLSEALTPAVSERLAVKGYACETGPVRLGGSQYLISATPIRVREERHGAVLVFSDFEEMQRSVLRASRSTAQASFEDILGESPGLCAAREQARQVAGTDVPVVLIGETGTGKEVFARAIHAASRRRGDVLMPLNCGSIPETLIESELFGYEKGAFTNASAAGKLGLFEICKNGTLFLDEIGDLALSAQVKLLRALEEKEIMRVGGTTPLRVNPRVISASHRDLRTMVAQQSFREDLYYRLNVVTITIPPLRERGGDVLLLARKFAKRFSAEYGKSLESLSPACEQLLLRYPFPGNIRELRNLMEYAVIFEKGHELSAETLEAKL
ncbi:MAG: sigma 54-interacting transcriptional regulator, partial [Oscillospiraceae bacterium]